jgi:hypothetical protein
VNVTRIDPRDQCWQDDHPIFRLYFWQEVSDSAYAADEYEVRDANVIDVLGWAEQERGDRTFTLYLRRDEASGIGLVLLAGSDPTEQPRAAHT